MSQVQTGLCDNLPNPEALTAQTRNLNQTEMLTQTRSVSPSQNEDGGRCGSIQKTSLNNNGKEEELRQGKDGYTGINTEEDEEEDIDEVMKEEDEEEESEESSCLNFCRSPDTPMTDSSYSETGRRPKKTAHIKGKKLLFMIFFDTFMLFRPTGGNRSTHST